MPAALRELAEETWQVLDGLADEGGDTAEAHAASDQLRVAYGEMYADAEAFAHSTTLAQRRTAAAEARREAEAGRTPRRGPPRGRPAAARGPRDGPGGRPPQPPQGPAPGALRTPVPPPPRTSPRSRGSPTTTSPGRGRAASGSTPGLTCVFRVQERGPQPALGAAADPRRRPARACWSTTAPTTARSRSRAAIAAECGAERPVHRAQLPAPVARAGGEHLATPATSVHSLTHFYNWCFSHVRTSYSMKWDGDMVLTPEGAGILRDLSWQLESTPDDRGDAAAPADRGGRVGPAGSTCRCASSSRGSIPMGPDFTFVKAFDWELREYPAGVERLVLQQGLCVEVKWLDADEYAHWRTEGVDFTHTRLYRKLREFEVDEAIRSGRAEELGGLVRVDAPPASTSSTTSPAPGCASSRDRWSRTASRVAARANLRDLTGREQEAQR